MSRPVEYLDGQCVCGRPIPAESPSDWACSEPCQSAWYQHQVDRAYPHPRDIRAAADARAGRRPPDGDRWQVAGMWTPAGDPLAGVGAYRRWCPTCRTRRDTMLYENTDTQECVQCGYQWLGRPLLGVVETRGAPWPAVRLRLSDGHRATTLSFNGSAATVLSDHAAGGLDHAWLRLERELGGGYADLDRVTARRERIRARRLARSWRNTAEQR